MIISNKRIIYTKINKTIVLKHFYETKIKGILRKESIKCLLNIFDKKKYIDTLI